MAVADTPRRVPSAALAKSTPNVCSVTGTYGLSGT